MRRAAVVVPIALVLLAPGPGLAQPLESFLALPIKGGDQLRIEDQSGAAFTGRLTHLAEGEIAVQTSAGEKRFTSAGVSEVAVRKQRRLLGTLVGAAVGAALGALADCRGGENNTCDLDLPILLGAGVGFGVGAAIHKTTVVYPQRGTHAFVAPTVSRGAFGLRAGLRW
jgi:hypothetical protein